MSIEVVVFYIMDSGKLVWDSPATQVVDSHNTFLSFLGYLRMSKCVKRVNDPNPGVTAKISPEKLLPSADKRRHRQSVLGGQKPRWSVVQSKLTNFKVSKKWQVPNGRRNLPIHTISLCGTKGACWIIRLDNDRGLSKSTYQQWNFPMQSSLQSLSEWCH